jgi:hypothetical protein
MGISNKKGATALADVTPVRASHRCVKTDYKNLFAARSA